MNAPLLRVGRQYLNPDTGVTYECVRAEYGQAQIRPTKGVRRTFYDRHDKLKTVVDRKVVIVSPRAILLDVTED